MLECTKIKLQYRQNRAKTFIIVDLFFINSIQHSKTVAQANITAHAIEKLAEICIICILVSRRLYIGGMIAMAPIAWAIPLSSRNPK